MTLVFESPKSESPLRCSFSLICYIATRPTFELYVIVFK